MGGRLTGLNLLWPHYAETLIPHHPLLGQLTFAENFPWMNFVGLCIVAHLAGAWMLLGAGDQVNPRLAWAGRFLAGRSYSLYLLHYPIQLMVAAWLWPMQSEVTRLVLVMTVSFALAFTIGHVVEPLRMPLRTYLNRLRTFRRADALAP